MKIEILGCSGGMGQGEFTTCIRIDDKLLIDAGSGLGNLSQSEMLEIRQVFLTHAHLDHVCFLPLLLDNLFEQLHSPVDVFALPEVVSVLQMHMFNWKIWPDFTCLPSSKNPVLRFNNISLGHEVDLQGYKVTAIHAQHVVPACGYRLESIDSKKVFCFSGDTIYDDAVVKAYDHMGPIGCLMLECAFPNRLQDVATKSRHLTPQTLSKLILSLQKRPEKILISHLKPAFRDEITMQLYDLNLPVELKILSSGDTFFL